MYCTIVERKCKKKPYRSHVYRKIKWRSYDFDPLQGTWDCEDEIPREPREKWVITLNESSREAGKMVKKQWHITTVRYWDIVEGYHSENIWCSIEKVFPESKTDGELYRKLEKLVYDKLQPIIDCVIAEYELSEEYQVKCTNDRLKKEKADEMEARKAEAERTQKEYEEASWRAFNERFKDYSFSSSGGNFKSNDKEMARELVIAGYKTLSKKYHPDAGGSNEQFQELGNLKDRLLKFI